MGVWCRVTVLSARGESCARWELTGYGDPDLSVVEALACHQLAVRRRGGRIVVDQVCPALSALLDVAGLRGQVVRHAEEREQGWVEEAVEPGDPTV